MMTADIHIEPSASRINIGFNNSVLTGLRVRTSAMRVKQRASRFADRQSGSRLEREVLVEFDEPSKVNCHFHHRPLMRFSSGLTVNLLAFELHQHADILFRGQEAAQLWLCPRPALAQP